MPPPAGLCHPEGLSPESRRCRAAVRRTYQALRDMGQPDRFALEAALEVYLWHNPEALSEGASALVESWVCDTPRH